MPWPVGCCARSVLSAPSWTRTSFPHNILHVETKVHENRESAICHATAAKFGKHLEKDQNCCMMCSFVLEAFKLQSLMCCGYRVPSCLILFKWLFSRVSSLAESVGRASWVAENGNNMNNMSVFLERICACDHYCIYIYITSLLYVAWSQWGCQQSIFFL